MYHSATCFSASLPIADFRTVPDTSKAKASPDLFETLFAMQRQQAWLRKHLVENEAEPLAFAASAHLADDPRVLGREMRRALGLDEGWEAKSVQMFTLARELAHIWLGEGGHSGFENLLPGNTGAEDWCNQAAARIFVPSRK